MSKYRKLVIGTALATLIGAAPALADKLGLGRPALPEEVAAWNLDVRPDGTGLPVGSGSVEDGEMVFSENCAVCHGEFAEGSGNWPKLAGGMDTLDRDDPLKTVGSYWPYLSTTWDYVHRSMPFGNAQSMSVDQVYAIVAYILYSNDLVEDDFVLSNENFLEVEMPNAGGFIVDDRAETEYPKWTGEPCMTGCKDSVEITMRAAVLDVTPEETKAKAAAAAPAPVEEAEADTAAPEAAPATGAPDPQLVAAGESLFKKCKACHEIGEGAKNKTGPVLNGVFGRAAASVEGFRYSKTLQDMSSQTWDAAALDAFLTDPKAYAPKTKMSFPGLKKEDERAAIQSQ
uniref:c-type cytochrome n=1 Tax=Actibacterium sp. TaxID=1872125 RepID=UPI003562AAA0